MTDETVTIDFNSTPRASLGNDEADQAGAFFSKLETPLTTSQLADLLITKGLNVDSRDSLISALDRFGYSRLRGFWITFERNGRFKKHAMLYDILEIEAFNQEISAFLFTQISPLEIFLRSQMSTVLGQNYGPRALHREDVFNSWKAFHALQVTLEREACQAKRAKKPLAIHYLDKYGQLPIWAEVECASLGTLSKAYGNLADSKVAKQIAARFGIPLAFMKSWLPYTTQIRNTCAHHDRLYNRAFCIVPKMLREHKTLDNTRLFAAFLVLFRLIDGINPDRANLARKQLGTIVDSHPGVDLGPVGFPDNWRETLSIPDPDKRDLVRPRGRNGGHPFKDAAVVEQALYLYDMREGTVAEIAKRCGLSLSTLYKYIHLREERENAERMEYGTVPLGRQSKY